MDTKAGGGKRQIDSPNVESHLQAALSRGEELLTAVRSLPDVDDQGHSECSFAEERYATKEELQEEVRRLLSFLQQDYTHVKSRMAAYKNDMVVVAAEQDKLHGDQARQHFSEAEVALAAKYKQCQKLLKRIEKAIQFLKLALREASAKEFPGKVPQKWPGTEMPDFPTPKEPHPLDIETAGADRELDDLFELDRRQQSDEQPAAKRVMGTHGQ